MEIKESNIYTQAIYKDERHRILLRKVWNQDLPSAAICMSNAGVLPSIYHMDYTTMFCINSLSALGYGSCNIVNLFSYMTIKLDLTGDLSELTCEENVGQIMKVAEDSDVFIWAVGSITNTYKKVASHQKILFDKLSPFQDKIHVIADSNGRKGLHPLSPTLRNKPWTLVPFKLPLSNEVEDAEVGQVEKRSDTPKRSTKKIVSE